jgi:hypothetical protein
MILSFWLNLNKLNILLLEKNVILDDAGNMGSLRIVRN